MSSGASSRARTSAIRCLSIVMSISGFLLSLLSVIISHFVPSQPLEASPRTRRFLKPKPRRMRFPAFPKPPDYIPVPRHYRSFTFSRTVVEPKPASRSLHQASRSLSSLPLHDSTEGLSRNQRVPLARADTPALPSHRVSKSVSHSPLQHYTPRLPSLDEEPLSKPLPALPSSRSSASTDSTRVEAETRTPRIHPRNAPATPDEMFVSRRPRTLSSPAHAPPQLPQIPPLPPIPRRARATTVSASTTPPLAASSRRARTKSLEKIKPLFLKSFASLSDLKERKPA